MSRECRVGLLGNSIGRSLSPALHMREAEHLGLAYDYTIVDLAGVPGVDLGAELARLEEQGYAAVNVTHPYKQAVLAHVDELSDVVRQIGSANLVLLGQGGRRAYNTDCTGFRSALESFLGQRPRGTVLQVGAGGAGLATAYSLVEMGFERVVVHDVVPAAAQALADRFAERSGGRVVTSDGDLEHWLGRVEGVVHVTPMGMYDHPGVAFDPALLPDGAWVAEVVYRPLETALLRAARDRGLATLDGGLMAVGQAYDSLRLITGVEPDRDRMLAHFHEIVESDPPG